MLFKQWSHRGTVKQWLHPCPTHPETSKDLHTGFHYNVRMGPLLQCLTPTTFPVLFCGTGLQGTVPYSQVLEYIK